MAGLDYSKWPLLVEACMEWIAQRWTKSMIRAELRDWFKDDIDSAACQAIIRAAKNEIKRIYNIDASEYRGRQISFYELIIREKKYYNELIKVESRIKAAERLDKLFNLEGIQAEDADAIAERVRAALDEMDKNQFSEVPDDARSELERLRKTYNDTQREGDIKTESKSNKPSKSNNAEQKSIEEDDGSRPTQGPSTTETEEPSKGQDQQEKQNTPDDIQTVDQIDIEDTAAFDDLTQKIKDLISNPENDEKFKQFEKRKKRRKDID